MEISPALLKDCQRGDRRAQFQLYRSCFDVLMGICRRYSTDDAEASEWINLGFLKILTQLGKYRPEVPFSAWIRRIMINTVIDEFRRNRKVTELIETKDFSESPSRELPIDWNAADRQFDAEALEALIRTLPPMSRKVFNLFAIDGYSHAEIAQLLNISEGTSKWHLSSARKRIQELIHGQMNALKPISHG